MGGSSPTQLRLSAAYFLAPRWGVAVNAGGDWFVATGADTRGQPASVGVAGMRLSGALAARMPLTSAVSAEAQLGYGVGALPALSASTGEVVSSPVTFHGPLAAVELAYDAETFFSGRLYARVLPFALSASVGGLPVQASSYAGGAQLGLGRFDAGSLRFSPVVDYELGLSSAARETFTLSQTVHRFGVGLRASHSPKEFSVAKVERPRTGPGRLRGRVLFAEGQRPAVGASVEVAGSPSVKTDARGEFFIPQVGPGPVQLKALAPGHRPLTQEVHVTAEEEVAVTLELVKPTGPGVIRGVVLLEKPEGPLADVEVAAEGAEPVRSGPDGSFVLTAVGPGPVTVTARAQGFQAAEEIVQVPPEAEATVTLLVRKKDQPKPLATLRGLVRSASGRPVPAVVRIPEAKVSTQVNADGRFVIRLPGGRYTLVIEAQGFVGQTKSIDVADGDQAILHYDLRPVTR